MKKIIILLAIVFSTSLYAQKTKYKVEENIPYYSDDEIKSNDYIKERCKLDIYYPTNMDKPFSTVVWFHGGGLTAGSKEIPEALKNNNIAVVGVNYRLYPKAKCPAYIEDAAAAVAWVYKNIDKYGGSSSLVFVSGHSAGGYLTSMIGLDKKWLEKYDVDADSLAGLVPFSGQAITHFTVRKERGISPLLPIIDEFAPTYHVRKNTPPILMITGDREMEMLGRYEENAYMQRMFKVIGNNNTELYELEGYGHNMVYPAIPLLLKFVNDHTPE